MAHAFGATGGFGNITGWDLQTANFTRQSDRVTAASKTNNESDSNIADRRKNWTCTYKANKNYAAAAPTLPANIGASLNSILLLSIAVNTTNSDFATMTLTGHEHVDGTDGAALRSVAHGITLDKGFGANDFDTSGGDSVNSSTVTISCDHAEVKDKDGDTSAGENHNPRIEVTAKWLGSGATAPAGYDETDYSEETGNDNFLYSNVSAHKALAFTE